jgi:hypothetical protein
VAIVTHHLYLREFEIKVSRSDFLADSKKVPKFGDISKWSQLEAGDESGPSQFWFCTPRLMLGRSDIPDWAGLWEFWWERISPTSSRLVMFESKKAPRLHRKPLSEYAVSRLQRNAMCRLLFQMTEEHHKRLSKREAHDD